MCATRAAKAELRRQMKLILHNLTLAEKQKQSAAVTQKLLADPAYQSANRVAIYLSMKDEIDTSDIMKDIFATNKVCFIPRYGQGTSDMLMLRLESLSDYEQLPETKWHIKQPSLDDKREDALDTGGLDCILVPGLAFTSNGERLGRGMGYYDRCLSKYLNLSNSSRPKLIALAFNEQVVQHVPTGDSDIAVDCVITERN